MSYMEVATGIASMLLLLSGAIAIVGAIGINRFPEAFTRAHAGTMVTVGGVMLALVCMSVLAVYSQTVPPQKILLLLVVIAVGAPASTHAVFRSALRKNVKPAIAWRNDLKREVEK